MSQQRITHEVSIHTTITTTPTPEEELDRDPTLPPTVTNFKINGVFIVRTADEYCGQSIRVRPQNPRTIEELSDIIGMLQNYLQEVTNA